MHHTRPARALRLAAVLTTAVAVFGCSDDDDDSDSAARSTTNGATSGTAGTTVAVATTTAGPASTPSETTGTTVAPERTTVAPTSTPAGTEPATTSAGEGFTYTSPEGDFSVVFPSRPSENTQPQQLPDGSVMNLSIAAVETEEMFMATARGQYPEGTELDVPAALQGAQDMAIANVEGTLVASRDLELQGRPGREFSASLTANGEQGTLLQRGLLRRTGALPEHRDRSG